MQYANIDGSTQDIRLTTLGLTATFFGVVTVNTTGSAVLAANASRKIGVWVQNKTATVFASVSDAIAQEGVSLSPALASNSAFPTFVPGNGAIYVRAATTPCSIIGYWI
jgi:hypothetical protein